MHTRNADCTLTDRSRLRRRANQQLFPDLEAFLGEVRLEVHDHLTAIAVRPGHSPDEQQIVHL